MAEFNQPQRARESMVTPRADERVTLENTETGERIECWPVDVGEIKAGKDGHLWKLVTAVPTGGPGETPQERAVRHRIDQLDPKTRDLAKDATAVDENDEDERRRQAGKEGRNPVPNEPQRPVVPSDLAPKPVPLPGQPKK